MEPWWSKILFVVLGSILAIGTSFVTMWAQQHFDKQRRAETLKVAFRGEINALRSALGVDARAAMEAWEQRKPIKDYKLAYPRRIYEAHAASVGDLRESVLVGHISQLYSTLEGRRMSDAASRRTPMPTTDRATLLFCWSSPSIKLWYSICA